MAAIGFERLEPYDGKLSRTVLRGGANSNVFLLPDYASVECLYHPELRELPVAVIGDVEARHGIILAKNQLAKQFDIKTGEAIWQAKQKCSKVSLFAGRCNGKYPMKGEKGCESRHIDD